MRLINIIPLLSLATAFSQPEWGSFEDKSHNHHDVHAHDLSEAARLSFLHGDQNIIQPKPESRLVIYVQTFTTPQHKPLSLLPLLDHDTKVTHVILASLHLHDAPGIIKLNDHDHDDVKWDRMWDEVKILQKAGIKVMVLLGGSARGTYSKLNGTEWEFYRYYHPLRDLVRHHNLDGIDLDIEEDVDITVPLRLLNAFYRDMGPSFIMTMSPLSTALISEEGQNPSGFSYFALDKFATVPGSERKLISWYNAMFYGPFAHGPPHYEDVTEQGWDHNRVVMGTLCSPNDGQPNGFLHVHQLMDKVKGLKVTYPGFGGVAGWEYYDAGDVDGMDGRPWEWVKEVGKALFYIWPQKEL